MLVRDGADSKDQSFFLCLTLSRIGYSIPMFAGFVIMFISTISEFAVDDFEWHSED